MKIIKGKKFVWRMPAVDSKVVDGIACAHNLSTPVAQTLAVRGLTQKAQINSFLFCAREDVVANPRILRGAQDGAARIVQALERQEKILIFGDYDVDGITSTALVLVALLPLGAQINYYLPNRAKEGYGLSVSVVERAVKNGYSLLITVDNGITANEAAQTAQRLGLDVIITDHHLPHNDVPPACAIINPNQVGCAYPFKQLAGVGVIFKLISLIYEEKNLALPDKVFELLMLGTVADMVPLMGENRWWVRHGLGMVGARKSIALSALAANGNLTQQKLSARDVGFMIAPQLNALGRLDDPREAVSFLITSDRALVERVSRQLKEMNEERKRVEQSIYSEIEQVIFNKHIDLERENIIVAASDKWPAGVIGLVAGKLMQNYGKPTFLFHATKDGILKGSCRSIPEFDIFSALEANKDLLVSFGGHACAAGLSLRKEHVAEFKERLEQRILEAVPADVLQPRIALDAPCKLSDLTHKMMSDLEQMEPFGMGNVQPTFMMRDVTLLKAPQLLKDKHVKCSVFSEGVIKPVIFFNRPDLLAYLNSLGESSFHIAGYAVKNEWKDQVSIEVQGLDVASAGVE